MLRSAAKSQIPLAGSGSRVTRSGPTNSELDLITVEILKDIHNRGAEFYNRGDISGCLRVYETLLRTLLPFLGHHPELQNYVTEELDQVSRTEGTQIHAYHLHDVIETVRTKLKEEIRKSATLVQPPPKPPEPIPVAFTVTPPMEDS